MLTLTGTVSAGSNYRREEVMLLLFKGPYRIAAQLIVGIALLVVGLVAHATLAAVIGGSPDRVGALQRDHRPSARQRRLRR